MLSAYKLYKIDKPLAHIPDPAGKAICTRHYNVDWTVHRLLPATVDRRHPIVQRSVGNIVAPISQRTKNGRKTAAPQRFREDTAKVFADSSPRWGERGERPIAGKTVPFPKKGQAEVAKKTIGIGTAGVGTVGYATNKKKLDSSFSSALGYSHPKYKKKIKKGAYTRYVY